MSHISVPPKHSNTKSIWCIIHVVCMITLLTLNDVGQGWRQNVPCGWPTFISHYHKLQSCHSWVTALLTCQTEPYTCQKIDKWWRHYHKVHLAILDDRKLSYIGRIIRKPQSSVVKQEIMTRAYDFITANAERKIKTKKFIPEVFEICKKYEMFELIYIYLKGGTFLEKRQWASIYKHNVKSAEREVWLQNMQMKDDCPLASLSIIGPHPHILWKIEKSDITIQHSCTETIKLLASPLSTNNPVCSRCGAIMVYRPIHVLMECSFLNVYRQSLWDDIVDLLQCWFISKRRLMCFIDYARWILGYVPRYRKRHLLIVYNQQCQTYQTFDWCLSTETDIWIGRCRGPVLIWRCHFSDVGSHCGDGIVIRPPCLHDGISLCWWLWDGVIVSNQTPAVLSETVI